MGTSIKKFWRARKSSEKAWLAGGALAIIAMIFYAYLFVPMQDERERLVKGMPQLRARAAQLVQDAAEVKRLRATLPVVTSGDLRQQITEAASAQGIPDKISEVVVLNSNSAKVIWKAVSFDNYVRWLSYLQTQKGLRVESTELNALGQPGQIAANVTLKAAR